MVKEDSNFFANRLIKEFLKNQQQINLLLLQKINALEREYERIVENFE